jgi:hypothetical protein
MNAQPARIVAYETAPAHLRASRLGRRPRRRSIGKPRKKNPAATTATLMEELLDEVEPGGGLVGGTLVHPVDAVLHWTSR